MWSTAGRLTRLLFCAKPIAPDQSSSGPTQCAPRHAEVQLVYDLLDIEQDFKTQEMEMIKRVCSACISNDHGLAMVPRSTFWWDSLAKSGAPISLDKDGMAIMELFTTAGEHYTDSLEQSPDLLKLQFVKRKLFYQCIMRHYPWHQAKLQSCAKVDDFSSLIAAGPQREILECLRAVDADIRNTLNYWSSSDATHRKSSFSDGCLLVLSKVRAGHPDARRCWEAVLRGHLGTVVLVDGNPESLLGSAADAVSREMLQHRCARARELFVLTFRSLIETERTNCLLLLKTLGFLFEQEDLYRAVSRLCTDASIKPHLIAEIVVELRSTSLIDAEEMYRRLYGSIRHRKSYSPRMLELCSSPKILALLSTKFLYSVLTGGALRRLSKRNRRAVISQILSAMDDEALLELLEHESNAMDGRLLRALSLGASKKRLAAFRSWLNSTEGEKSGLIENAYAQLLSKTLGWLAGTDSPQVKRSSSE
ncbi:hypothetical protein PAPHI01_1648 [Pancytospora philotis]|nr:hypothetical protein PAPHI01_1648 [Pancytospora philotis]